MSPLNDSFKALSDPTRRQIILLLRGRNMTAGEIADHFQISKPSISHHLGVLKQADLIQDERQGQNIMYYLNTSVLDDVLGWFLNLSGKSPKEEKNHEQTE